ncbi:MAG: hypothetical protein LLG20_27380 [Acidobacteriales bacterium]|nr:hypothetical protein [Terriglobales bacterium]
MPGPHELPDTASCRCCQRTGQMHLPLEERQAPVLPEPRNLNRAVKQALAQDVRECRYSRDEIIQRMYAVTGHMVGLSTLDAMLAESKDHRFPAEWIPAWVIATGSRRLLALLCAEAGLYLADATEHDLAQLARLSIETKKASARAERLRRELWERVS